MIRRSNSSVSSSRSMESLEGRRLLSVAVNNAVLTLTGGSGNDTYSVVPSGTNISVTENGGAAKLFAASSIKSISASLGGGNDSISIANALKINASVSGGDGADGIITGGGDDTLDGGTGDDYLDGRDGNDTVSYASRTTPITATLTESYSQAYAGPTAPLVTRGGSGGAAGEKDTYASIETLSGGSAADRLSTSAGRFQYAGEGTEISPPLHAMQINGNGGDDQLFPGASSSSDYSGNSFLQIIADGGDGNDSFQTAFSELNNMTLHGASGDDSFYDGTDDQAVIDGGSGFDTYSRDTKVIRSYTMPAGLEKFVANDGADTITGNDDDNVIIVGNSAKLVDGRGGNDLIQRIAGSISTVLGGSGNDTVINGSGDDSIDGGIGNDSLDGGAGKDTINGGDGDDTIITGDGDDSVIPSSGNDIVDGQSTGTPGASKIRVNFQPAGTPTPAGYIADTGGVFGSRNGAQYGWNVDNSGNTRRRGANPDARLDTLIHLELNGSHTWEYSLPNGTYDVEIGAGDPGYTDQVNSLNVEGITLTDPDGRDNTDILSTRVIVNDGRLTVRMASNGSNAKLNYIDITPVATPAVPAAPTELAVSLYSSAPSFLLTWKDNATNEQQYRVERRISTFGNWETIATLGAGTTGFVDSTVNYGTYTYRVFATNAAGDSAPSNEVVALAQQAPTAPRAYGAVAVDGGVRINQSGSSDTNSYRLERRVASTSAWSTVTAAQQVNQYDSTLIDPTAQPGTRYEYRVFAINSGGVSPASNIVSVMTPAANGFTGVDIGSPTKGSTQFLTAADFNIVAGGRDIWGTADQFRFVQKNITGDFDYSARVVSATMAGLMARESLASNSRHIFMRSDYSNLRANYRLTTGGHSVGVGQIPVQYLGGYVRLQRVGNVFTAYGSTDGTNWTQVTRQTMAMPATIYFGMAATAKHPSALNQASIRELTNRRAPVATVPVAPGMGEFYIPDYKAVRLSVQDNSLNETGFRIERRLADSTAWSTIATKPANSSGYNQFEFEDTNVVAGMEYVYRVFAFNAAGDSVPTPELSVTMRVTRPNAATNLTLANTADGVRLNWQDNADDETHYQVNRGSTPYNANPIATLPADSTSFLDSSAADGVQYFYTVYAINSAGFSYSPPDQTIIADRSGTRAATPTNLAAAVVPEGIRVTWNDVSTNETGFRIDRTTNDYSGDQTIWETIGTTAANTTQFLDTNIKTNVYYSYRVTATGAAGDSAPTNDHVYAVREGPHIPDAPTNVAATAAAEGITVTWAGDGAYVTDYQVERRVGTSGAWSLIKVLPYDKQAYTDTAITAGTTYSYRVRGFGTEGVGPYSAEASATAVAVTNTFTSTNIGVTGGSTQTVTAGKSYDVTAGGSDVWLASDEFRFVQRQLSGNFDVKVRVEYIRTADLQSMGGLMARASLDANSANVFVKTRTDGKNRVTYRSSAGGQTVGVGGGSSSFPNGWLRLVRSGNIFTGYSSTDGTTWTVISTATVSLPTTLYVGMAASAHTSGNASTTVQFRDLTIA